jgi:hypothetical protein
MDGPSLRFDPATYLGPFLPLWAPKAGTGFVVYVTIEAHVCEGGGPMASLVCPCARGADLWGEFWWVDREYKWVFFDDDNTSETFTEQVTHCSGCGTPLDRKTLKVTSPIVRHQ